MFLNEESSEIEKSGILYVDLTENILIAPPVVALLSSKVVLINDAPVIDAAPPVVAELFMNLTRVPKN